MLNQSFDSLLTKYNTAKESRGRIGGFLEIFKHIFPSKEDIESQLIDINSIIENIDFENYNFEILSSELSQVDEKVKSGTYTWQKYYASLDKNKQWIAQWAAKTQGSVRTLDDFKKAYTDARKPMVDFNTQLKNSTLRAKASNAAIKGLAMAGNMLAGMAVGVAINLAVKAIDHYINRVKYAREALADANAEYKNTVSEIENINTELDSLAEKMHALTIASAERLQVKILSAVKVHLLIQFRKKASRKKVLYTPPSIEQKR